MRAGGPSSPSPGGACGGGGDNHPPADTPGAQPVADAGGDVTTMVTPAAATNAILESCETLDTVAGEVGNEASAKLQDATTKIYEACSFQDITGQRITKIVGTLKTIEVKVARIVETFGSDAARMPEVPIDREPMDELLNGPQLPTQAMDQSDIDKLMASFD